MVFLVLFFAVCVSADLVNFKGQCRLDQHPSVEYRCIVSGAIEGSRVCDASEPAGTIVSPRCRRPNYYSATPLNYMRCFDGYWDYIARCSPECGRITPDGKGLAVGGKNVKRGELPWHAGIYNTAFNPYMQICGGSLISNNVVLSAAHCFWNDLEKQLPASRFAVAVGKLYRPWDDMKDQGQKSNVKVIHLPERYQGASANFQDDIAVVIVLQQFEFKTYIRPVCLSFDYHFEKQQLYSGNNGKVAGWGLTAANGKPSPVLQVVNLPYVEVGTCINRSPPDFREYITSDKICAGTLQPNSALCKGDSGGGLAFPESIRGIERFYLRGVVSTAPTSDNACNTDTYTSFTSIMKHEHFIKQFWSESGQFKCQDGSFITAANYCDGTKECPDGSDETVWACSAKICSSYLFQCAYGACVDRGATCNGVLECADGSDEAEDLCNKLGITPLIIPQPAPLDTKFSGTTNTSRPNEVMVVTAQSGAKFRNDYKLYPLADGYFKVHAVPADFDAASLLCQAEGGDIALPSNPEMVAVIKKLVTTAVPKHKVYLAGLRHTFGKHSNIAINGIAPEVLQNEWDAVESADKERCLGYSTDGTVWDRKCADELPFICYRKHFDTDVVTQCGTVDRGYTLDASTGHCYKLHTQAETWERAQKTCYSEGGHLAIINSMAEAQTFNTLVQKSSVNGVALGFRVWGDVDSWWTVEGQTLDEAGYSEWCPGCPDNTINDRSGQSCGGLINGKLHTIPCNKPYPFICEKTKNSLTKDVTENCHGGSVPCKNCVE